MTQIIKLLKHTTYKPSTFSLLLGLDK